MIKENNLIYSRYKHVDFEKAQNEIANPYVVPNVAAIARQMTGSSQIMIIVGRFFSLKFEDMLRFGWNNIPFVMSILKMDFAAGVKVLCELEILRAMENDKTNHFVFHYQMVDMSLAFGNKKVLGNFFYLSKKYKFIPGIISNNPEKLIKFLSGFPRLPESLVVYTPFRLMGDHLLSVIEKSKLKFIDI